MILCLRLLCAKSIVERSGVMNPNQPAIRGSRFRRDCFQRKLLLDYFVTSHLNAEDAFTAVSYTSDSRKSRKQIASERTARDHHTAQTFEPRSERGGNEDSEPGSLCTPALPLHFPGVVILWKVIQ